MKLLPPLDVELSDLLWCKHIVSHMEMIHSQHFSLRLSSLHVTPDTEVSETGKRIGAWGYCGMKTSGTVI